MLFFTAVSSFCSPYDDTSGGLSHCGAGRNAGFFPSLLNVGTESLAHVEGIDPSYPLPSTTVVYVGM